MSTIFAYSDSIILWLKN